MKKLIVFLLFLTACHLAQSPILKREFRGGWIATVTNLDWPSSRTLTVAQQKAELLLLLDTLKNAGINVVVFQVRTECDALYNSPYEPWSYWLTGTQGTAPSPLYDPLEFVVEETHKRGMELHAWFNPYRAERSVGNYTLSPQHVTVQHPDWALTCGTIKLIDPGLPQVREHIVKVITDVVSRYDIDGIHMDDYFYPYPPNQITNQDDSTFANHNRGFVDRGDWRRDNVNLTIKMINDSTKAIKPKLKFGMSPFGIWKNGVPSGITGLDAYNVIYCDAMAWMKEEAIDYLVPQLYWPFGGSQDFGTLMPWWADSCASYGVHYYPGIAAYKLDETSSQYNDTEIPRQIRAIRNNSDKCQGEIYFRAKKFVTNPKGFADSIKTDLNRTIALVPTMPWLDSIPPNPATNFVATISAGDTVLLTWEKSAEASDGDTAFLYVLYAFDSASVEESDFEIPENLVLLTRELSVKLGPSYADKYFAICALDRLWNESEPVYPTVSVNNRNIAANSFELSQNYPNPFNPTATIEFTLPEAAFVQLKVYDVLGREVAELVGELKSSGKHRVIFDAGKYNLSSGIYLYKLDAGIFHSTKKMSLIK